MMSKPILQKDWKYGNIFWAEHFCEFVIEWWSQSQTNDDAKAQVWKASNVYSSINENIILEWHLYTTYDDGNCNISRRKAGCLLIICGPHIGRLYATHILLFILSSLLFLL